ncbi:hypothetical protein [Ralstonia pseudosolanacearum]|uniref:hypothetical protein n=1 Tax=Ralstonia pseudosolanacearum TaxID=1310165 RepID=UPI00386AE2F4
MTYPEALHAVPASWGVAPREAVEGVWNQRVPKLATVAVNVAPQEVLCPSKVRISVKVISRFGERDQVRKGVLRGQEIVA